MISRFISKQIEQLSLHKGQSATHLTDPLKKQLDDWGITTEEKTAICKALDDHRDSIHNPKLTPNV